MKILLTGTAGFIGSHLAARLGARGDAVVGLDNFDETLYPARLHRRNLALVAAQVDFHEGDFLDAALVESLFAAHRFDVVEMMIYCHVSKCGFCVARVSGHGRITKC